jgi:hypothetical protein
VVFVQEIQTLDETNQKTKTMIKDIICDWNGKELQDT